MGASAMNTSKKILLIDDSALSRSIIKRALGNNFQYLEASDGMSGLESYFLDKPDLVILDLTMPGINGLEVLSKLREMDPQARIVIGTADIQEFSRHQAEDLGAIGFIVKPFTTENIQDVVGKALHPDGG
jgi:two-component system chemotaxis response regulator CheY